MSAGQAMGGDGVRVRLLGQFQVTCGPDVLRLPQSGRRLVAFLALQDRPVLRSFVAGNLWLDCTEDRAHGNLRSALWRLRQPGPDIVVGDGIHIGLHPSVSVDVRDAASAARAVLEGGSPKGDIAGPSLGGDLLPDWYDDWVVFERERLRQLRLHALDALCRRLVEVGELARAIDVGMTAVAAEPLRETAQRAVIAAHLAEGNMAEALRQYRGYAEMLWDALGALPSFDLDDLRADGSAGAPRRPRDAIRTVG